MQKIFYSIRIFNFSDECQLLSLSFLAILPFALNTSVIVKAVPSIKASINR